MILKVIKFMVVLFDKSLDGQSVVQKFGSSVQPVD